MAEWLHFNFVLSCIGEGNGNPLQCSCLENPRDGGAQWAAIGGVAQSRTRLKRRSSGILSLKAQHSENEDHGIRSHHLMGNRWGNSGNSVRLYFGGLQNHCKWWLQLWNQQTHTPWRKVTINLDSILKSRDVTLSTKVRLVKAMVFPVVMYGCES